jgi:hypothetical protein
MRNSDASLILLERWDLDVVRREKGRLCSAASTATPDVSGLYRNADRIGSIITPRSGDILIPAKPKDFNLPGKKTEQKPDLAARYAENAGIFIQSGKPRIPRMARITELPSACVMMM